MVVLRLRVEGAAHHDVGAPVAHRLGGSVATVGMGESEAKSPRTITWDRVAPPAEGWCYLIAVLLDRQEVTFIIPIAKLRISCSGDSDKTRPYLEMVNGSRDETGTV